MSIYVGNKKIYPDGYGGQDFWAVPYDMTITNYNSSGNVSFSLGLWNKTCDSIDGVSVEGVEFSLSNGVWRGDGVMNTTLKFAVTYTLGGVQYVYEAPFGIYIDGDGYGHYSSPVLSDLNN